MAAYRRVMKSCIWYPKDIKPKYREGGDNRIILCSQLMDGVKCVCYYILRPDGTLLSKSNVYHSEEYIRKHHLAMQWEHVMIDYWAWVTDIIPI